MGIFKGFKTMTYPKYTVVCPQTGYTFDVRTMNVMETNKLKTSLTTPAKTASTINKTLWESIEDKPEQIVTYEDFRKSTTLRDREALMYGLYHCTFGDQKDFTVSCNSCNHSQTVKITLSKIFSMNAYPFSVPMLYSYKIAKAVDENVHDPVIERKLVMNEVKRSIVELDDRPIDAPDDDDMTVKFVEEDEVIQKPELEESNIKQCEESILERTIDLELPISKVHVIIRQPTIKDEEDLMAEIPFVNKKDSDLIHETLVIKQFEEYAKGSKIPTQIVSDRGDILYGYQTLPPMDKIKIFDTYQEQFGQYGIELKSSYICDSCGEKNEMEVDIVSQFFRMVAVS